MSCVWRNYSTNKETWSKGIADGQRQLPNVPPHGVKDHFTAVEEQTVGTEGLHEGYRDSRIRQGEGGQGTSFTGDCKMGRSLSSRLTRAWGIRGRVVTAGAETRFSAIRGELGRVNRPIAYYVVIQRTGA